MQGWGSSRCYTRRKADKTDCPSSDKRFLCCRDRRIPLKNRLFRGGSPQARRRALPNKHTSAPHPRASPYRKNPFDTARPHRHTKAQAMLYPFRSQAPRSECGMAVRTATPNRQKHLNSALREYPAACMPSFCRGSYKTSRRRCNYNPKNRLRDY